MARPKKDLSTPEARLRLIDALWTLLETQRLHETTVGMVASEAGCNRGTFYYHYTDMDDLVYSAIELELMGNDGLAADIFSMVTATGEEPAHRALSGERLRRLRLIMDRGGMDLVVSKVKALVVDMWRAVLRPDGRELTLETRLVIEYAASGMIGMLSLHPESGCGRPQRVDPPQDFLQRNSSLIVGYLSEREGVPAEDVLARLQMVSRLPRTRTQRPAENR